MITQSLFKPTQTQIDKHDVYQYTLTNSLATKAVFINLGARLTQLHLVDRQGVIDDVVLGFDDLESYRTHGRYFGATCGRYANRIANAAFELDGVQYQLDDNESPNHLHGGSEGLDQKYWQVSLDEINNKIEFSTDCVDGEMGYPGHVHVRVSYQLTEQNELLIEMRASTDKATPINLVHHSFFNLAGQQAENVLAHKIKMNCDHYTPIDSAKIPTGDISTVLDTPFDLRDMKYIGHYADFFHSDGGYDHNFCVNNYNGKLQQGCTVYHPPSGRVMVVESNQPGIQFYTANHLDGSRLAKNGIAMKKHAGLALETQCYPNAINVADFPGTVLLPQQEYQHMMRLSFCVKDDEVAS
ncbi:aldose epimerase family protein [Gammaproteobacteria bacterium AS21]